MATWATSPGPRARARACVCACVCGNVERHSGPHGNVERTPPDPPDGNVERTRRTPQTATWSNALATFSYPRQTPLGPRNPAMKSAAISSKSTPQSSTPQSLSLPPFLALHDKHNTANGPSSAPPAATGVTWSAVKGFSLVAWWGSLLYPKQTFPKRLRCSLTASARLLRSRAL